MTVYTGILTDVPQTESTQAGTTFLSVVSDTVLNYNPHNRIKAIYTITALSSGLTITLPPALDEGFDFFVKNIGVNDFTLVGTGFSQVIEPEELWLLYFDASLNVQAIKQLSLTPAFVAALAGFALDASGTTLNVNAQDLAGAGLTAASPSSPLNVNADNSTVEVVGGVVQIKDLGITGPKFANATIGAEKFTGTLATLTPLSGSNAALASNGTIVVATPGGTVANQFFRMTEVLELVGGSEWRVMREQDYRVDLSREDQVTVTKLTAGPSNVRVQVCGVT